MKLHTQSRRTVGITFLLWMACVVIAAMPGWTVRAKAAQVPVAAAIPAEVFDGEQWQVADSRANTYEVLTSDGRQVIKATGRSLLIVSSGAIESDTRVTMLFRVAEERGGTATLTAGLQDVLNMKEKGVYAGFSTRSGAINWTMFDPNSTWRLPMTRGTYRPEFKVARSLAWPDSLRRNVEADMVASEPLSSRWLTLEVVYHGDSFEASIDGLPMANVRDASISTNGRMRLLLQPGVELASLRMHKTDAIDDGWVYRPVSLKSVLNASEIDGKVLDLAGVSKSGALSVAGVPFVLAVQDGQDGQANDHVDIGKSWFRQGNLDGRFSGRGSDAMAARWAGAMVHDPARLTVRLPYAPYRAIHLLAAADGDADSMPVVTAQFYRADSGFPKSYASRVPLFTAKASDVKKVAVKNTDGSQGSLYLVTIPIEPGDLAEFADLDYIELELTKEVQLYRASPDPLYYSTHAAGLPSSVHVYAATVERPRADVTIAPSMYGDIWTQPQKPSYNITLRNRQGKARNIQLELTTTSLDGQHITKQKKSVSLPADKAVDVTLPVSPEAFGYHDVKLQITDGSEVWSLNRSLAYLHEDTRERGNWDFGRGPLFGFYNWRGGHITPSTDKQLTVMAKAGIETIQGNYQEYIKSDDDGKIAKAIEKYKLFTLKFANSGDHYVTARFADDLQKKGYDEARAKFLADIEKFKSEPGPHSRPTIISWFPEPSIGPYTHGIFPEFIGEEPYVFTPAEQKRYEFFRDGFVQGAKIMREVYPGVKNLMPHGDPSFIIHFLQHDPKMVAPLLDGVTVDIPAFERLPEQQFHQVSMHRLYMTKQMIAKAGIKKFLLPMYEGPCVPSGPGALTNQEQADLTIRDSLILQAYGVDIQNGGFPAFDTASYWGEQHYGFGVLNRVSLETPKPAYTALATMTRHLNRSNFDGYALTGSNTVYALRFKHFKTGKRVYAMWTLRGKRPVTIQTNGNAKLQVFDQMDNLIELKQSADGVTFTLDQSPCYVHGLDSDPAITLGDPDHSDAAPANISKKLANLGDGSWTIKMQQEKAYEDSHTPYIFRYPSPMTATPVSAPEAQGGKALSIHFADPQKDRVFVPYYSVLSPAKPITIPGKASHLGLWVKGASDWGRAIYFVRDAKGEQWINVGAAGAWNCDDLHSWMSFNFDGWRYLRMELPANSPYDQYREAGSTWWGAYSSGDGCIDLPITLEKIVVERRTHVMYVDSPKPADRSDVLLGDLIAEYKTANDATDETVRLAAIRMPVPKATAVKGLDNPIARLTEEGQGPAIAITNITLPQQQADGTRCYVHFPEVENAKGYQVWASDNEEGEGALQMGRIWKGSGQLVRGLRANKDFYLFVAYLDADGKLSKPSKPFKINLEDFFGMK